MADDDVAVDDVVEKLRQVRFLARLHVAGEAAGLEIFLDALPSLPSVREGEEFGIGERKELQRDMPSRQLARPLALEKRGVGTGYADAETLVELLEHVELPSVHLVDFVEVEATGAAPLDDLVQTGRIGKLQRDELRRVELQVEPRIGRAADALRHQRAFSAAADAREHEGVRLQDLPGDLDPARQPGRPPLFGPALLVGDCLQIFDGDHPCLRFC